MTVSEKEIILTEEDLREALKEFGTYIDVTERDLKLLFDIALRIAKQRCAHSWIASEIMTGDVITVTADTDVYEAGRLMIRHKVSGLPVVDEQRRIIGIITQADLLKLAGIPRGHIFNNAVMRYIRHRPSSGMVSTKVGDIMTKDVITVTASTSVKTIAGLLRKKGIKRVPVVDPDGRVIGIVSRTDILRVICSEEKDL